jgi:RsiW-degrading membrane proteinase PrsW (M82 family)
MTGPKPRCSQCSRPAVGPFCAYCGVRTAVAQTATWQSRFLDGNVQPFVLDDAFLEATTLWSIVVQPFLHIAEIPRRTRRAIVLLALFGVVPLAAAVLTTSTSVQYWTLAFYFSLLWAAFFAVLYHDEGADVKIALAMYFGTALFSIPLLLLVLQSGLEDARRISIESPHVLVALRANVLDVGVPEELTKALVLFILCRVVKLPPLRLFIYYGLLSGLGFGFYEAVKYQEHMNLDAAIAQLGRGSSSAEKQAFAAYYIGNVLRLTSAPFFHAVWTGIAAFFIWFGMRFPAHRVGFIALAMLVPAVLHGAYDGFLAAKQPALTVLIALLSAGLLGLFVGSAVHLERKVELMGGRHRGSTA